MGERQRVSKGGSKGVGRGSMWVAQRVGMGGGMGRGRGLVRGMGSKGGGGVVCEWLRGLVWGWSEGWVALYCTNTAISRECIGYTQTHTHYRKLD
jgi:hypothetical protein